MRSLNIFLAVMLTSLLTGCNIGPHSILESKRQEPPQIPAEIKFESDELFDIQQQFHESIEKKAPQEVNVEPLMPEYDPLADQMVSFSMVDENIQVILYSLSQAVGMNFIIDPGIITDEKKITLNFETVSASTVLKEILTSYDLYYEIKENVIRVKPYQEHLFRLNFLNADVKSNFIIGGDVLGAEEDKPASGLSGTFKMTGTGGNQGNGYDVIEDIVKRVLSDGGTYTLNRIAGSLYVKDTPAVIRTISRIIRHFKEMVSRQILIEAQSLEIALSDDYRYGIDWSAVRSLDNEATKLTNISWTLGEGLLLAGTSGDYAISAVIDALTTYGELKIVSNPSIRTIHGSPSIITVGESISYKKSVRQTSFGTGLDRDFTTEVEVSTVFDGLILGVIPFVEKNGRISLLIDPIKSDVEEQSLLPVPVGSGESISLPRVRIKEMSATIAVNSGDVVILGGLIDKEKITVDEGVPILSAIPLIGYLFKDLNTFDTVRELVIVLSVRII